MKITAALAFFTFLALISFSQASSYSLSQDKDVLLSRQVRAVDCNSKDCRDCKAPCNGCDMCPLCAFCFGNTNPPCDNCKHCGSGANAVSDCKKKCNRGKNSPKCKECRKNC
eukprot:TRINITY_DN23326_c0_g1_i1.p1 TRINITY_DN23326_c0_g1~~TRINITY_DN23326_c0_g1_i1.p1  ORF type:complete len:112 (-),score=9.01 TRINITY_DN23326_c0_g1_i1:48-383(-)